MKKIIKIISISVLVIASSLHTGIIVNAQSVDKKETLYPIKKTKTINFNKNTMPRIDGSTATIPLSEGMAIELLGMNQIEASQFIHHNTTHAAYENLALGKCDIIFVTPPAEDELNYQSSLNKAPVDLNQFQMVPVVNDAFVFLVNDKNKVSSLTIEQLRNIYSGKTKNWAAVGGGNITIKAFQRQDLSGSQTLFYKFIMPKEQLMKAPTDLSVASMGGLIESISKYNGAEGAIGYSVYYYANTMYPGDHSKLLAVEGILPTDESIMKGEYPFISPYYAVIKKSSPKDSPERKLIAFLLSDDGQRLARKCGYVPIRAIEENL